jgi:hypothetical protein
MIIRYLLAISLVFSAWCEAGPQMKIINDSLDFGIVPARSMFYGKIIIKSTGTDTLRIREIDPICPCIKIPLPTEKYVLAPGDSAVVEVSYDSEETIGTRNRYPHIYSNVGKNRYDFERITVKAFLVEDLAASKTVYAFPFKLIASQFGDIAVSEFPFEIINNSKETIPLRLINADLEYYDLKFPAFVPPNDTAKGMIILNEKGRQSEFEKSITFEFVNEINEKKNYSIPVTRKIFKK